MKLLNHSRLLVLTMVLVLASCRHGKDLGKSGTGSLKESLGVSNNEIRDNKIYRFVDDWYGTPYKYGGCTKSGVDCSCFTANLVAHVYGRKLGRTAGEIWKECDKVGGGNLKEGDLVFFIINGKSISHVGVYLKNNKFAHASTKRGVIVSDLNEAYYKKYFYAAGRLKKEST